MSGGSSSGLEESRTDPCAAGFIDLQIAQRRPQDRRLDTEPVGAAHEVADHMITLSRPPVFDIEQHRGSGIGADLTKCAAVHVCNRVCNRGGRRITLGGRDADAFVESRVDKTRSGWRRSDLTGAGAGQYGYRCGRGKAGEFRPHLGDNVVAERARNTPGRKSSVDRLAAGRVLPGQFPEQSLPVSVAWHHDLSLRGAHHRKQRDAAEHSGGAETLAQQRDVVDPVQHRQYRAAGPRRRNEIVDRSVEVIGLAGDEHDVVGPINSAGGHGLDWLLNSPSARLMTSPRSASCAARAGRTKNVTSAPPFTSMPP